MMQPTPDTPEQVAAKRALLKKYGAQVMEIAQAVGSLKNCLAALRHHELPKDERHECYDRAIAAVAKLMHAVPLSAQDLHKVADCAHEMDTLVDLWVADDIEQNGGKLPPLPPIKP